MEMNEEEMQAVLAMGLLDDVATDTALSELDSLINKDMSSFLTSTPDQKTFKSFNINFKADPTG